VALAKMQANLAAAEAGKASAQTVASGELLLAFKDLMGRAGNADRDPKLAMEQLEKTCKAFAEASTCIPAAAMVGTDEPLLTNVVESVGKFICSKPLDEAMVESARALLKSAKLAFPTSADVVDMSKRLDDIITAVTIRSWPFSLQGWSPHGGWAKSSSARQTMRARRSSPRSGKRLSSSLA
jgi:hypothetical protein